MLMLLLLFSFSMSCVGRQLPDVFWNSSNPIFHSPSESASIEAELMDSLEIICPLYNDTVTLDQAEYSIIYMVSEYGFENCLLDDERPVGQCYSPYTETVIKLIFREFTPLPNGLEFEPEQTYYFITTSDGSVPGIHKRKNGLCSSANMKFRVRIKPTANSFKQAIKEARPVVNSKLKPDRAKSTPTTVHQQSMEENSNWAVNSNDLIEDAFRHSLPLQAETDQTENNNFIIPEVSIYQLNSRNEMEKPWNHHAPRPPLILYEIHEVVNQDSPNSLFAYSHSNAAKLSTLMMFTFFTLTIFIAHFGQISLPVDCSKRALQKFAQPIVPHSLDYCFLSFSLGQYRHRLDAGNGEFLLFLSAICT
ncbi:Ephrin-B2 [Trichinella zimbabwensis]|uniref:Ephrin-B2 n=1 Tax=Trichinella zimbabwensis TaxID=268475 RepID=A0A0V1HQE0_9BILA|nr:Ephrin-B2 [Trichinella zimbabwensis]